MEEVSVLVSVRPYLHRINSRCVDRKLPLHRLYVRHTGVLYSRTGGQPPGDYGIERWHTLVTGFKNNRVQSGGETIPSRWFWTRTSRWNLSFWDWSLLTGPVRGLLRTQVKLFFIKYFCSRLPTTSFILRVMLSSPVGPSEDGSTEMNPNCHFFVSYESSTW